MSKKNKNNKNNEYIERLKYLDQKKNANNTVSVLLDILKKIKLDKIEKDIVMNDLSTLKNLPNYEKIAKEKIQDNIKEIDLYLKEYEEEKKKIQDLIAIFEFLEALKKKLEKIKFNEKTGFVWSTSDEYNNVHNLTNLSENILNITEKKLNFFTKDENTNKDLLKLYHYLSDYLNSNLFKRLYFYRDNGDLIENFSKIYVQIINLMKTLKNDTENIVVKRKDIKKYHAELKDENIAIKLNKLINNIIKEIDIVLEHKEKIIKEFKLMEKAQLQIIESMKTDKAFLKGLKNPRIFEQLLRKKQRLFIDEPYYIEAKTTKVFYKHELGFDPTGVFNKKESEERLFKQNPVFDNEHFYGMNDNINGLLKNYFEHGDKLINNFSGYFQEIYNLVKRSPKLDKNIKGFLIIPSYMEEKSIKHSLEKYARCNDIDKIAIILLENKLINKKRDSTLMKIQSFRLKHPNVKIYHVFKSFSKKVPIGYIRKYATEYALALKYYSKNSGNMILIGGDADCLKIGKDFFTLTIKSFEDNKYLDAVQMKMDFPWEYLTSYPNLWVMHRLFDFSWSFMRNKISPTHEIRMYGPSSAIKASSYLMIKGYNPNTKLCEDLQLSWLLDEARRYALDNVDAQVRFFEYLSKKQSIVVTNPRRGISYFLNNINLLDSYKNFDVNNFFPELDWDELLEKGEKFVLNVGNKYSNEEIRNAINEAHKNKGQNELATSLAFYLQRYVDWWQRKVDPRGYKQLFKNVKDIQEVADEDLSKYMSFPNFMKMLNRILTFIGIDFEFERSTPYWEINILDVSKLKENIDKRLESRGINKKIKLINTVENKKDIKHLKKSKGSKLIIVGHDFGGVGDVTRSRKVMNFCRTKGLETYLLDLHTDIIDKKDIDLLKIQEEGSVILSGTWMSNQNKFIEFDIINKFPTIASCGTKSFHDFKLENKKADWVGQLSKFDLIYALYPISIDILLRFGIPKHKIILLQHIYPKKTLDSIYNNKIKHHDKHIDKKIEYIKEISKRMGKEINPSRDSILIGSISRIVKYYGNSEILECLAEICRKHNNIFLLFKSKFKNDDTCDKNFYKFAQKYANEPWFLHDENRSSQEKIYELFSYLDLALFANDVGNSAVEMASLGTPLLLSNTSGNISIFNNIAYFFNVEKIDSIHRKKDLNLINIKIDKKDFIDKINRFLSLKKSDIEKKQKSLRKYCETHFSEENYFKKIKLAMNAAKIYYQYRLNPSNSKLKKQNEKLKKEIENKLSENLDSFDWNSWKNSVK